jgi:hypothetical protein
MLGGKRVIVYELNEVPLRILDWFAAKNPKSAIGRLMRRSRVIQSVAQDEGGLSPWITWPTLHRGVLNTAHTIHDFGQDLRDINRDFPSVWEILARGGRKVGMFGSLHSYPLPAKLDDYAFYVPDTFAAGPECFPEKFEAFQGFNLAMVDRSGRNVSSGIALNGLAKFLASAPGLGLRGVTVAKLAGQLAAERLQPRRVVRRRTSQVQIAFDFFLKELRRTEPEVSFFFTNHLASSMHRYWPALFPQDYTDKFWTEEWAGHWGGEIGFATREASAQIGHLMRFVENDPRYTLAVMTSMGQAALANYDDLIRTVLTFKDIRQFMRLMGIADDEWRRERAMVPLYTVGVTPQLAEVFAERARSVTVNGQPLSVEPRGYGVYRLELGNNNLDEAAIDIRFGDRRVTLAEAGMQNENTQDEASCYGYHVPEGSLVLYDPARAGSAADAGRASVSTLEIAPALLANFGVDRPGYMVAPTAPLH